jgi:hypothetical protein
MKNTGFAEYPEVKSLVSDDPRAGNFTSSEIVALTTKGKEKDSFGVPFYSYIEEKKMERRLNRSISEDVFAKPLSWGNLCEGYVHSLLPKDEYLLCSKTVLSHPTIDCWKGTPDATKPETVADFKCPQTLKSFCILVDSWQKGGINLVRKNHKDGEKFYWQLVSNAILTKAKYAELIVFAPYRSELNIIREMAQNFDGVNQQRFIWIALATDDELPFLLDGGHYKNVNVMRFEIPPADKFFLHSRVEKAREFLMFDPNNF